MVVKRSRLWPRVDGRQAVARLGDMLFFGFYALYLGAAVVWLLVGVSPLLIQLVPGLRGALIDWGNDALIHPQGVINAIGRLVNNIIAYSFSLRSQASLQSLFSLLNIILAVAVIRFRPNNLAARFLAIAMIGTGAVFNLQAHVVENIWPALYRLHDYFHYTSGAAYIYALVLFPDGRASPYRNSEQSALRWLAYFMFLPLLGLLFGFMTDGEPEGLVLYFGVMIPLAGVAAQLYRYRRASTESDRQPSRVILWALSIAFGLAVLFIPLAVWLDSETGLFWQTWWDLRGIVFVLFPLLFAIIPLSLTVAIIRYRLWDIDLLLNRTLVYGMLSAIVIGLYILTVGSLSALFQSSGNLAISLVATGLVAVVFQPLRERLQRTVNRFVYGDRDDPYAVLARLGRRLEATLAPEAVLPTIVETIQEALKSPYVSIELGMTMDDGPGAVKGLRLPLMYQGEAVGVLLVAPRSPGEPFSVADRRLLENIARQAGVAAHAVRLTQDLQHARERLIATREEERRRLRRDLHDGLGPTLATLAIQADTARETVQTNPGQAERLMGEVTAQAQTAIADIRRLVYDLRPPTLDDLGLVGALRVLTDRFDTSGVSMVIEASEPLPVLPAAVEVAVYRITQEALTNAVRHAQARQCRVRLWFEREDNGQATVDECEASLWDGPWTALWLEVSDDGQGIVNGHRAGVGIASMRERAEELGGTCHIEPGPSGGTVVRVRLPLA